jgi:hypothetical protein
MPKMVTATCEKVRSDSHGIKLRLDDGTTVFLYTQEARELSVELKNAAAEAEALNSRLDY